MGSWRYLQNLIDIVVLDEDWNLGHILPLGQLHESLGGHWCRLNVLALMWNIITSFCNVEAHLGSNLIHKMQTFSHAFSYAPLHMTKLSFRNVMCSMFSSAFEDLQIISRAREVEAIWTQSGDPTTEVCSSSHRLSSAVPNPLCINPPTSNRRRTFHDKRFKGIL